MKKEELLFVITPWSSRANNRVEIRYGLRPHKKLVKRWMGVVGSL
jgi:hypothetical protein